MRVLIFTNYDVGLYKFRKELLEAFSAAGFEVYASLPDGQFIGKIEELGCRFIPTELNRRGTNPLEELKLYNNYKKILKQIRPDVVLTYTIKPNLYGGLACKKYGVPYICNITGLGSALENKGILQPVLTQLYKLALTRASMVFFQNQDNLEFMRKHDIVKDNYDLIPGSGVNLKQYAYTPYPDDKTIDFVFVGRMMKEKGFDLYLDTAEYIHARYPQTRFHICGIKEESFEERVKDLADKGICIYHGLVDDMRAVYEKMHCIIHPTYYPEGMSNVLLEACACGRPIITTDRPGCKEIVDDGRNGFVVKQKDLSDLIAKVEQFLALDHEERAEMGRQARLKVEQQFDRQIVVDKYMQEIKRHDREG